MNRANQELLDKLDDVKRFAEELIEENKRLREPCNSPVPERPLQKVKVDGWFISKCNRLVKCSRVEWNKDRWAYFSKTNAFYSEDEFTPIIHLQREDEDRPFEAGDRVEWYEGLLKFHGILINTNSDGTSDVSVAKSRQIRPISDSRLRFSKQRER